MIEPKYTCPNCTADYSMIVDFVLKKSTSPQLLSHPCSSCKEEVWIQTTSAGTARVFIKRVLEDGEPDPNLESHRDMLEDEARATGSDLRWGSLSDLKYNCPHCEMNIISKVAGWDADNRPPPYGVFVNCPNCEGKLKIERYPGDERPRLLPYAPDPGKSKTDWINTRTGKPYEEVDHPPHYSHGGIEAIDVIEAWKLDFCLGSAIKYICRAGSKPGQDALTDLDKASWYINREIDWRRNQNGS